jgi:hypothetical protein
VLAPIDTGTVTTSAKISPFTFNNFGGELCAQERRAAAQVASLLARRPVPPTEAGEGEEATRSRDIAAVENHERPAQAPGLAGKACRMRLR